VDRYTCPADDHRTQLAVQSSAMSGLNPDGNLRRVNGVGRSGVEE
jgi:hypothetical protein